ncbi:MAG: ParB/RepB/Spo0J family partition protein [Lachnospiraceae bacterium]|nr:ParB/RepB/Spo0J family partition protein [Lachnospiraceae bacterium]
MAQKKGLGKGLDVLIPVGTLDNDKKKDNNLTADTYIKITKIEPNPNQPRKHFDDDTLQSLSESIKQKGIIDPLIVQDMEDHYEIIAGERRWRAAKLAGLKEVPVIIRKYTEQEKMEIALIDNIQREELNPIDEAKAYKDLIEKYDLKQDEVAERVSKSRTAVTNSMRLLKLDHRVQEMVIQESISQGHARALLAIEDGDEQFRLAQDIMDKDLSVREIEKQVKKLKDPKDNKKKKKNSYDIIYKDLEEKLKQVIGTKVVISAKDDSKGKIEIEYYSKDDLEKITDALLNAEK